MTSLFDICACSCAITEKLFKGKMHCTCPEEMRVLGAEVKFLVDQRGGYRENTSSKYLGLDGKKILGLERYVYNAIFLQGIQGGSHGCHAWP